MLVIQNQVTLSETHLESVVVVVCIIQIMGLKNSAGNQIKLQ